MCIAIDFLNYLLSYFDYRYLQSLQPMEGRIFNIIPLALFLQQIFGVLQIIHTKYTYKCLSKS